MNVRKWKRSKANCAYLFCLALLSLMLIFLTFTQLYWGG